MIRYDLVCDKGHAFDGWFRDSAAYDEQAAQNLVTCSQCGSTEIQKQLMTPGLPAKSNRKGERVEKADASQKMLAGPVDPRAAMMMKMMRELRTEVERTAEHVGDKFAEEARKIHYGEAEKRGIYGEATGEDAKALLEEGIEVHPLPWLPDDAN
jgi:hypothetical protein